MERSSTTSSIVGSFNTEDIRNLVERGKKSGLIMGPGDAPPAPRLPGASDDKTPPPNGVKTVWMQVDPDTAKLWLASNIGNRRIKEDVVHAYARDMINGVWMPTHQGIAFNEKNQLIDGQHRLSAIVLSGKTVRMVVTFGLPSKVENKEMTTMDAVDRGCIRSTADRLKIQHGIKNANVIVAITTLLGELCAEKRTRRLSVDQTLRIYRAFKLETDWVAANRSKQVGLRAAGVNAAFVFALCGAGQAGDDQSYSDIEDMFPSLVHGTDLIAGTPIALLRDLLTSEDAKLIGRGANRGLSELVLQVIHEQLEGTQLEAIELKFEGVKRFRALQPEACSTIAKIFALPV